MSTQAVTPNQDKLSGEDLAALTETYRHLKDSGDARADKVGAYIRNVVQTGTHEPMDPGNPDHAGFFSSLGSDLWGMAKGVPTMIANAVPGSEWVPDSVRAKVGLGPAPDVIAQGQHIAQHYQQQKTEGRSLPYRLLTPLAETAGANVSGMEKAADQGDVAGVAGHAAAVPTAMAATYGAAKGAPLVSDAASRALLLGKTPEGAYESALKPSTTIPAAKRAAIVQTGLQEGIPISKAGIAKIADQLDDLQDAVTQKIKAGAGQGVTVNPYKVASRLNDTAAKFQTQVNPEADLNAVSSAGNEFLRNNPQAIPADQAQAMKVGTYRQLTSKAYGEMGSATIESQKALARGIKEELAAQIPELNQINAAEGRLYDLQPVLEKAVNRISNHQLVGIGTPVTAAAARAVTGSARVGAVAGFLKAVLDDPAVKSRLAIAISKGGNIPPGAAMQRVAGYSTALAVAAANQNQEGQ